MRPDRVELVVIGESLDSGHFPYGEVTRSTSGIYCVVSSAWPMHACPDGLGLGIEVTGFMALVAGGLSDLIVPIHAVRFPEVSECVA